ncbi:hypothetical protein LEMLEM_LOCUS13990 [Lemmus lemmus]
MCPSWFRAGKLGLTKQCWLPPLLTSTTSCFWGMRPDSPYPVSLRQMPSRDCFSSFIQGASACHWMHSLPISL